jgi:hypothetical protein
MPEMPEKRHAIFLCHEQYEALRDLAHGLRVPMTQILSRWVADGLQRAANKRNAREEKL